MCERLDRSLRGGIADVLAGSKPSRRRTCHRVGLVRAARLLSGHQLHSRSSRPVARDQRRRASGHPGAEVPGARDDHRRPASGGTRTRSRRDHPRRRSREGTRSRWCSSPSPPDPGTTHCPRPSASPSGWSSRSSRSSSGLAARPHACWCASARVTDAGPSLTAGLVGRARVLVVVSVSHNPACAGSSPRIAARPGRRSRPCCIFAPDRQEANRSGDETRTPT